MEQKPVIRTAQLHRRCCDYKYNGAQPSGNVSKASWELYLVVYNTTAPWPSHQWAVSRRHHVPTIAARNAALAELGYAPAPGAVWEWQETETPDGHGHPSEPAFLGTIDIVPLEQTADAEDGDR
ncbi:DUF6303 family protein [Streptomyces sp. NPDC030592]|uniref:DUF6303 family protein n=1 Tax=Streptomyces sp. NPDC030592 TaxID=3155365 RepID=UPI0033F864B3